MSRPTPQDDAHAKLIKLDPSTALPGYSDGLQAAHAYTPEEWLDTATGAAVRLAETGHPFTVDHLRDAGVPEPDRPQRWGSLMAGLSQSRIIEFYGLTIHQTKNSGPAPIRIWRGVL